MRELGPRFVLPAIGTAVGGVPGSIAGSAAAAMYGKGNTIIKNALADPYVSTRLLGAGQAAFGGLGAAIEGAGPAASRTAVDKYLQYIGDDKEEPWSSMVAEDK